MKLLLHTCCGDCLLRYLEVTNCRPQDELLRNEAAAPATAAVKLNLSDITVFFYNPNIYPKSEYDARLAVVQDLTERYKLPLMVADYQPDQYFGMVKGKEGRRWELQQFAKSERLSFPNQEGRCGECWSLRLARTLLEAEKMNGIVGGEEVERMKGAERSKGVERSKITHFSTTLLVSQYQSVARIEAIAQKLRDNRPVHFLAPETAVAQQYRTGGFYKQNYCGCLFSLIERTREKY